MSYLRFVLNSWAACSSSVLPPFLPPGAVVIGTVWGILHCKRQGFHCFILQNIPHPGRSFWQETLCCAGRRVNPVQRPRKSLLGSCGSQGPGPSVPQSLGSKGGQEAPSPFFAELKRQPSGQGTLGLLGWLWWGCTALPGAVIPKEVEMLPLGRGFPPWKWDLPHGGCCRSALPQGSRYGLACFPGAEAGRRQWA